MPQSPCTAGMMSQFHPQSLPLPQTLGTASWDPWHWASELWRCCRQVGELLPLKQLNRGKGGEILALQHSLLLKLIGFSSFMALMWLEPCHISRSSQETRHCMRAKYWL